MSAVSEREVTGTRVCCGHKESDSSLHLRYPPQTRRRRRTSKTGSSSSVCVVTSSGHVSKTFTVSSGHEHTEHDGVSAAHATHTGGHTSHDSNLYFKRQARDTFEHTDKGFRAHLCGSILRVASIRVCACGLEQDSEKLTATAQCGD